MVARILEELQVRMPEYPTCDVSMFHLQRRCEQLPEYPSLQETEDAEARLRKCSPLVFAGEIRDLTARLAQVGVNEFLFCQADLASSSYTIISPRRSKETGSC